MKILSVVVLVLFLSASFCAKNGPNDAPKLIIVSIELDTKDTSNYLMSETRLKSGDTLMFTSQNIMMAATVIIPFADMLCHLESGDITEDAGGITFLLIPLIEGDPKGTQDDWKSRKFIIKKHKKKTTYEYSAFIHSKKKMAEGKSSPIIIVDP